LTSGPSNVRDSRRKLFLFIGAYPSTAPDQSTTNWRSTNEKELQRLELTMIEAEIAVVYSQVALRVAECVYNDAG